MCGLIGIGGPRGSALVRQRLADLTHRGPDDEGIWTSPELTLGHRRLSIIGLDEGGRQPMTSSSGESILIFNGEIYNYLELADTLEAEGRSVNRNYDSAILLEALEAWGTEVLPRLNGMFALVWYRPRARRLLLARDRWGKKPLFWGRADVGGGERPLVISSELSTFRRLSGGPPPPDPLGVARYLVYDGMPDTATVYRGVQKLAAASWLELDPEGRELGSAGYWSFTPRPTESEPAAAAERALEALSTSFRLRLRSDVPVGLFLSGGLDSSLLAALWRRLRPDDTIRTFTIGFEDPSYDERPSARLMAELIGSEHHEAVLTGADLERELDFIWENLPEPFADPSIVPTSYLCRLARQEVVVALGGDGGDELQAGYDPFRAWGSSRMAERFLPRAFWYRGFKLIESLLPASPANMSLRFKARHFGQGFLHPPEERIQGWMASYPLPLALASMSPDLASEVEPEEVLQPTREAFRALSAAGELHAQIHTWLKTYLECSILTKMDRASMMHSLEVRAPFLDPQVARSLTDLPPELIFKGSRGKQLLRLLAARMLPEQLLGKPKKGFGVPQATWLRTILRERVEEALDRTRSGGWFEHSAIERIWRAHLTGRADYRKPLWSFLFASPFQ
jgi:asparagine synthase (glutamine-hydrolysing)